MGADLYLNSVFKPQHDQYAPLFDEWVQKRDALKAAGEDAEADAAQQKVLEYYDKMFERGYFRDSYNSSNLLRMFGMSWWGETMTLVDDEGEMSPDDAQRLLDMMVEREEQFTINLEEQDPGEEWTKAEMETYFRDKYERFKAFLREAIALDEAILCSI